MLSLLVDSSLILMQTDSVVCEYGICDLLSIKLTLPEVVIGPNCDQDSELPLEADLRLERQSRDSALQRNKK